MTNILYIHDFADSSESQTVKNLQKYLGKDFNLFTHSFNNDLGAFATMQQNIAAAKELIQTNKISIVIASSMGGFVAMHCAGIVRILINPCMLPSEQIKLRLAPCITDNELEKYKEFEKSIIIDNEERLFTFGLFSTNDEPFSYRDRFNKVYNEKYAHTMSGGHRISEDNIKNKLLPLINFAIEEVKEHHRIFELQEKHSIFDDCFMKK